VPDNIRLRDGHTFNFDVQQVIAIPVGKETLLLLPDAYFSMSEIGRTERDIGVTIVL